jgi:hypothetical protein
MKEVWTCVELAFGGRGFVFRILEQGGIRAVVTLEPRPALCRAYSYSLNPELPVHLLKPTLNASRGGRALVKGCHADSTVSVSRDSGPMEGADKSEGYGCGAASRDPK